MPTITAIRRKAGLPPSDNHGGPPARSRTQALAESVESYGEGHARWTGPMAGRMPQLYAEGSRFNARAVAFEQHHGRPPAGRIRSNCGVTTCMTGAHLTDRTLRHAQPEEEPDTVPTPPAATPAPSTPPVDDLLAWGDNHSDPEIRAQAARVRGALTGLRQRYAADQELSAISTEAADLEKRLAELRAREAELAPKKQKKVTLGYSSPEVRAWAKANNVDCPATGRVPNSVVTAWRAATSSTSGATP
ncbi:hypothetical protein [Streptomyces sp. NPDC005799]|uniref:Lsr2 family DNA-binding protein n=1 Tax=Streptomyces sp. NPDC005799 TaxID=3154678 RepID=UPI00340D7035